MKSPSYLSLPILGVGLVVGLIVSLFQAVTQIQETTLIFVPKIIVVLLSLLFLISLDDAEDDVLYGTADRSVYPGMFGERMESMMPAIYSTGHFTQFQSFLLILMRVAPILFMMPLLSARNVPNLLKIGLTLTVSLILWPVVQDRCLCPSRRIPMASGSF